MQFTRARDLLLAGLVGLGVVFLLFQFAYRSIQSLPTLAGVTLLVLAVVDIGLALWVRGMIRSARVTNAIVVARMVALAKASSLLGAIMGGAWSGALLYLLPRDQIAAAREDVPSAVVGVVCAAALVGAGLWLEHSCRTPEPKDRDESGESAKRN